MEQTICVWGNSIAWGAWDPEKGGWVNRLRLALEEVDDDLMVYNLGVSGDTSTDFLERFDGEAKAREPSTIIFSVGDNDAAVTLSAKKHLVSLEQFEKNIRELIRQARTWTDRILFVGTQGIDETKTNPVSWNSDIAYKKEDVKQYEDKIKQIASEKQAHFVAIPWLEPHEFEDGLHPNTKGHENIMQAVKKYLYDHKLIE